MLTFLHQTADSVNDGARRATSHYESSHAALLLIICMQCETWTAAKVLTLKHLTGSIIFTRVCVFNELLFHMLHETLYGFFFFLNPSFFLNCPEFFHAGKKKSSISASGCFSCRKHNFVFVFFQLWLEKKCRSQDWCNIQDRVIISYAREARGWWCSLGNII